MNINDRIDQMAAKMAKGFDDSHIDRIAALEAGIIEALRSRDEDMRPILRKALHGGDGK